jgi:hypothetical protein
MASRRLRIARTLPVVEPILLTPRPDPFDDPAWLFEPKYDGYRGLLYVTRNGCHFRSKRGNLLRRFEELCHWVRELLSVKEAILDGEVVALDSEGWQDFRDLRAGRGNLHYAAFDALWIDGKDLRPLLVARRKQLLTRLIPATTTVLSGVLDCGARAGPVRSGRAVGPGGDCGQAEGGSLRYASYLVQDKVSNVHAGRRTVGTVPTLEMTRRPYRLLRLLSHSAYT